MIGANPALFNQAYAHGVVEACGLDCSGLWVEYPWQIETGLAREPLAMQLLIAESEIEKFLGVSLRPRLQSRLQRIYQPHDVLSGIKIVLPPDALWDYRPYIPHKVASVDQTGVSIVDLDGDGFAEMALISFTSPVAISLENAVLYVGGAFGAPVARIRPLHRVICTDVGGGVYAVTYHVPIWQIIEPERLHARAFGKNIGVDLSDPDVLLKDFDVGYMRLGPEMPMARFYYDVPEIACGRPNCQICTEQFTHGILEKRGEYFWVRPAQYNQDEQRWEPIVNYPCTCAQNPSAVEVFWYASASTPNPLNELDPLLKQAVVYLAAARFNRVKCDCECGNQMIFRSMQADISVVENKGRYVSNTMLSCPFGLRVGEQEAWRLLNNFVGAGLKLSRAVA